VPPPLVASYIASPTTGNVPFTVNFTGIASGGTPPYSYNWNFGDGGNSAQQNPSHTYNAAGNYTVTFTVTDSQSIQDSVSLTITATLSPTPAYLSCSPTNFYFGVSVSGTLTSSQNMRIINAGDGTMTWNAAENTPWLSCSPLSGMNRGQVAVSVNASGLSPGTYNAIITVSSPQAYNSPQLIEVNLRVHESGLESDPSEGTDNLLEGTPVGGRATRAERRLVDARLKEVGTRTNSDPNNPIAANASNGLVSKGSVLIADNSTENSDLGQSKLKSDNQQDKTDRLEIELKEIQRGFMLQSAVDRESEENRMTINQATTLDPMKDKSQLDTERKTTNIINVQIEEMEPLRIVFTSSLRENISFIGWGEDEQTALPIGSTLDMENGEFSWIPQPGSIGQYILHFAVTDGSRKSQPLQIVVDVLFQEATTKK
jgi:PKD repeat protein